MLNWTRLLVAETVSAFNGGETQKAIALRLQISRKAVSRRLCLARQGAPGSQGLHIARRCGPKKKGQPAP